MLDIPKDLAQPIETVAIQVDGSDEPVIINLSDFNPQIHTLFNQPSQTGKTENRVKTPARKPAQKAKQPTRAARKPKPEAEHKPPEETPVAEETLPEEPAPRGAAAKRRSTPRKSK